MSKVFIIVVVALAIILLSLALPGIPASVRSFRTDVLTQSYMVTTGAGVTIASVALSHPLWESSTAYVTNISSNTTADAPVADNYTSASKSLNLSGLADNTTRTLTVSYYTGGLDEYTGADVGVTKIPGIVVGLFALIPLALLVYAFTHK